MKALTSSIFSSFNANKVNPSFSELIWGSNQVLLIANLLVFEKLRFDCIRLCRRRLKLIFGTIQWGINKRNRKEIPSERTCRFKLFMIAFRDASRSFNLTMFVSMRGAIFDLISFAPFSPTFLSSLLFSFLTLGLLRKIKKEKNSH